MTDTTQDFLVEIGTEELPPKALERLSEAFLDGICGGFEQQHLRYRVANPFATPRRLAVLVKGVDARQADQDIERRGPALKAAFDADGKPTKAAQGFARSCGVAAEQLDRLKTDKGEWLVFRDTQTGKATAELVTDIVHNALAALPIPKRMRWGDTDFEFVRPVHWAVMMLDEQVIEADILGVKTNNRTRGHRYHHPDELEIPHAADYASVLDEKGKVLPVLSTRRTKIRLLAEEAAEFCDGTAVIDEDLLSEVASLVEWPVAVTGSFDKEFLEVPPEALISAMKGHQKYFHLVDGEGQLLPNFITMSNIDSSNPDAVRAGNERVIRPRLADAQFFWKQDGAHTLESRLERLKTVVFENKLGHLFDKSQRIADLAGHIAELLQADLLQGTRAGLLCKSDLLTEMVGEFPELQGIMGEYYARNDKETNTVATAVREHYLPRYWGDQLPETPIGQAVALADRLDTLIGIFGIGKQPTGDKDPYGLRRSALGVVRIVIEQGLALDLQALLEKAVNAYPAGLLADNTAQQVYAYILERLRGFYQEQNVSADSVDAVLSCQPASLLDAHQRIESVEMFRALPAAAALAAANKRIHNILKKTEQNIPDRADPTYFQEAAERALFEAIDNSRGSVETHVKAGKYMAALEVLAGLRDTVDEFFDKVMVMAEDPQVRDNRLALLASLRALFLQIADVSRLQA